MLDKTSKKIVEYLNSQPDKTCFYSMSMPSDLGFKIGSHEETSAAINFLIDEKIIEWLIDSKGRKYGIRLSHTERHKNEFALINVLSYLKSKWIDILALIISLLALAKSYQVEITSLIQTITQ